MERPLVPPEPPLSDGVIVLRPWRRGDAPVLASVFGSADADLAYWMDEVPQPYTLADAVAYVDRSQAGWRGEVPATPFAICDVVSADVLGWLGLTWDEAREGTVVAGYWMRQEARGRGVATRALRLAAAWVFGELGQRLPGLLPQPLQPLAHPDDLDRHHPCLAPVLGDGRPRCPQARSCLLLQAGLPRGRLGRPHGWVPHPLRLQPGGEGRAGRAYPVTAAPGSDDDAPERQQRCGQALVCLRAVATRRRGERQGCAPGIA